MSNPKHQVTGDSLPKGLAKTIYEQAKHPNQLHRHLKIIQGEAVKVIKEDL